MARAGVYALLAAGWVVAAWLLAQSVVPDDLSLPHVDVKATFGAALVSKAERYERFLYVNWALAQIVALATLWIYAKKGTRFIRESAAGPIGTGMLLGMLGLAIVWLTQLPFSVAALWCDRRHDVSEVGYFEAIFGGWLELGGTFVAVCVALLVVMALARWLGSWWWIPGAAVFAAIAALLKGQSVPQNPVIMNTCYSMVDGRNAMHVTSIHKYDAAQKTLLPVKGAGGVSPKASELEGTYAWGWARNIWADSLGSV